METAKRQGKMKSIAQVLFDAGKLLAKENGWTRGCFARTESGMPTDYNDEVWAKSFCVSGAILASVDGNNKLDDYYKRVESARGYVVRVVGDAIIPDWNDNKAKDQSEAVQVVDAALVLAIQESDPGADPGAVIEAMVDAAK